MGYGEGSVITLMFDDREEGEWQKDAREILEHVDAGCRVLLSRAHKAPDAAPVIPSATD